VLLAVMATALFALAPIGSAQAELESVPADVAASIASAKEAQIYIVQMRQPPVIAFDGSRAYAATRPEAGEKLDLRDPDVKDYTKFLRRRHNAALRNVGGEKVHDYVWSFNGFSAKMTPAQATAMQARWDVTQVWADELLQPATSTTPDFLGLTAEGGLWDQGYTGEDVVIGIVDSGIWPESLSFTDRVEKGDASAPTYDRPSRLAYQQIPGWNGRCRPGEEFVASDCNQKLIAAQYYNGGFGGNAATKAAFPYEYLSARDADGHGTHTASTAGGNANVPVEVAGIDLGMISGMAPRARIAAYKVCWGTGDEGGCFSSDSVRAIDQAVRDGVDVINFSISGSQTSFLDPVEVAFLYAADAGIFVAASAGNSGPDASTVAHNSPWLTTVAAGTHDRYYGGTVTLGDGSVYEGASIDSRGAGPAPLVYSSDVGLAGADPTEVQLCYPGTLDPALVTGKIVVCDRGVIARVDKSLAVYQAGGIGSVLANVSPASLNADLHSVPTVHVDDVAGAAIRAYAQTPGATAVLTGGDLQQAEAPEVASFSSRGPALASGDLLKPDIMAPGVDVLASVSPAGYGRDFDFLSGTSMSSPHMAGLAALMVDAHPDWSPMAIKSAYMTTASQETNMGDPIPGTPFGYGAGQATPNSAVDPGLVYEAGWTDWLGFLCGTGQLQASYCPSIGIDPSDLNYPSIAIADLAGSQTVTRTVTNVGPAGTYDVSVDAPAGIDVTVDPASLPLAEGQSATYSVTFATNASATIGAYTFGSLTWSHGPHAVRSPIAIKPVALAAPAEVFGAGSDGSLSFDVTFGFGGDYTAAPHGLEPALMTEGNVLDDPGNSFAPFGPGTTLHMINVPAGAAYARFSLFDEYTDGNDDLDLYVYYPTGTYAGGSGSGTSAEQVDLLFPMAGDYYVFVHGWQTDGPDSNYTLFSWSFSATPGSTNMMLTAPTAATLGATESITVDWSGLDAGTKYLGAVSHSDSSGIVGLTLVNIATD
jgi:subtilisin family serine protease